ncbi:MAG TPA: hypothetical protein VG457_02170 [Planctomycetota bacterium]|nr:hypothetical protein [Planctomycetota bacterium]
MSINISQIFVRYPDEKDVAALLAARQDRSPGSPSSLVARTGSPWLAVCSGDNAPSPETARHLSRALEGTVIWFGLAGNALASRYIRYALGNEAEKTLEPPEIFQAEPAAVMPAYRDVEQELYVRLRGLGIPQEYVYLFMEEIGVSGGSPGSTDAVVVRNGTVEQFVHRVPRRSVDEVRTLYDHHKEGEQTVFETLRLQGAFEHGRARQLLQTLEAMSRRRRLPPGWKLKFRLEPDLDPDFVMRLVAVFAAGRYSYDLTREEL